MNDIILFSIYIIGVAFSFIIFLAFVADDIRDDDSIQLLTSVCILILMSVFWILLWPLVLITWGVTKFLECQYKH